MAAHNTQKANLGIHTHVWVLYVEIEIYSIAYYNVLQQLKHSATKLPLVGLTRSS